MSEIGVLLKLSAYIIDLMSWTGQPQRIRKYVIINLVEIENSVPYREFNMEQGPAKTSPNKHILLYNTHRL